MIKDHAHAIEVLSNCIPYFNQTDSIDFGTANQLFFKWNNKKFLLKYEETKLFELRGELKCVGEPSILMEALIKKELYPGVNFIKG